MPPISRTQSGSTPQTPFHDEPALGKRKRPEGEPAATEPRQGTASATGAPESLTALGRPPSSSGREKIGYFSVLTKCDSGALEKLRNLPELSSKKNQAFLGRAEKRMASTDPKTADGKDALKDYFLSNKLTGRINSALRGVEPAKVETDVEGSVEATGTESDDEPAGPMSLEDAASWVRPMMPMLTSVPVGREFNRILSATEGCGSKPLGSADFAQMEHRLKSVEPGTVIREEGLMSTASGTKAHGEWNGERGIHLRLTAGEKGVRTMGIGVEDPVDFVFPPGQRMVILKTETAPVEQQSSSVKRDMLTVHAALLPTAAFGDHELQAPSDSEPESP